MPVRQCSPMYWWTGAGFMMAAHGCTADEAFQRLVEQSQRRNVKLHDIACQLLASLTSTAR
jgi:AmiR/NasT family two-component response regulator